jgi:hypothetical protein
MGSARLYARHQDVGAGITYETLRRQVDPIHVRFLCTWTQPGRRHPGTYYLLLLVALCTTQAIAQVNMGSVVVVEASKHAAILASDSRIVRSNGEVLNNHCKLATVQPDFVFGAVGVGGETGVWETTSAGRSAAEAVLRNTQQRNEETLGQIAQQWSDSAIHWLMSKDAGFLNSMVSSLGEDRIFTGVFVLHLPDSSIAYKIRSISLHVSADRKRATAIPNDVPIRVPAGEDRFSLATLGFTTVADLFNSQHPPDYIQQERAILQRMPNGLSSASYEARRYVELTIAHGNQTVGGHVNMLEITNNGISWLTNTGDCKDK